MASDSNTTLGFRDVPDDISPNYLPYTCTLRQKQRAVAFCRGSYLSSIKFHSTLNQNSSFFIVARVYKSQRKSESPHKINITISKTEKKVQDAFCTCKAGSSGKCSHILAVILILEEWKVAGFKEVPDQPSSTSLPQQWDRPRGPKIEAEPVSSMIIAKPGNLKRKRKPVMALFNDNRNIEVKDSDLTLLKTLKSSPISYLTENSTNDTVDTPIGPQLVGSALSYQAPLITPKPEMKEMSSCGDVVFPKMDNLPCLEEVNENKEEWAHLEIDIDRSHTIQLETKEQSNSHQWFEERKPRLTASSFGHIMNRKKAINDAFIRNHCNRTSFTSTATSYGISNERIAKQMYIKKTNNHLHETGLIINPNIPFLGATPDALVCDNGVTGIVEIKCPYSARDMDIRQACGIKNFFLEENGNLFTLKKNSLHWHQVQGQLLITGAPFCEFVTYTRRELKVERIYPCGNSITNLLAKLLQVYIKNFKPFQQ